MALKRRAFYTTPRLASLGLCLTLSLAFALYVAAELPNRTGQQGQLHLGQWLGRKLYQISGEIELWLHIGHRDITPPKESPTEIGRQNQNPLDPVAALGVDPAGLREALSLYKAGDIAQADMVAETAPDPLVRTTLAWMAMRFLAPDTGFDRMQAFLDEHPAWPSRTAIEHRMEEMLFLNNASAAKIDAFFSGSAPKPFWASSLWRAPSRQTATAPMRSGSSAPSGTNPPCRSGSKIG